MSERFTEHFIKSLKAPERGSYIRWDAELTGFSVRVFAPTRANPKGARTFYLSYWHKGERRYRIGSSPDWSVQAAREEAKAVRQRVDRGDDPQTERQELKDAPTLTDLFARFKTEHVVRKAPRTQRDYNNAIENYVLPRLGMDRRVRDIHQGDIQQLHRDITVAHGPVQANHVLTPLSKMFSLSLRPLPGEDKPWRDQAMGNPCRGIERNLEHAKDRFLSSAELAAVTEGLAAYGRTAASDCLRLIMLSGCRPCEAIGSTWSQFDQEAGYWNKPAPTTKQRKMHRVPLNPGARELIESLRKADSKPGDFVFPGQRNNGPLQTLRPCWIAVCEHATVLLWRTSINKAVMKVVADLEHKLKRIPTIPECRAEAAQRGVALPAGVVGVRVYDLRHSFASVGAGGGLSLPIIGKLLGHSTARSTMRYAHLADDPLVEATEKIGTVIAGAGKSADVVKLRAGRW